MVAAPRLRNRHYPVNNDALESLEIIERNPPTLECLKHTECCRVILTPGQRRRVVGVYCSACDAWSEPKDAKSKSDVILERFKRGPVTGEELAQLVGVWYMSAITKLRTAGHKIDTHCVNGVWTYSLKGGKR